MGEITVIADHARRRQRRGWRPVLWPVVIAIVLGGCHTPSKLAETVNESPHEVFCLKAITAERGKAVLSELGLTEVARAQEPNCLLVGGLPEDLRRGGIVLALVDVNDPYVVQRLAPAVEVRTLPSNSQIAESIGSVTIGTFSKPPGQGGGAQAIIDIHADSVWAIVPARLWPDVHAVVESGGKALRYRRQDERGSEPNTLAPSPVVANHAAPGRPLEPAARDVAPVEVDKQTEQRAQSMTEDQAATSHEPAVVGRAIVPRRSARDASHEPARTAVPGARKSLDKAGVDAIGQTNREAFEKHELEFQNRQNWPGMKPKPTEPVKVLDAR
jgi:hypothetical protein